MADSVEDRVERLEKVVRALRDTVADQGQTMRADRRGLGYAVAGSALAGVLFALTASVWAVEESRYGDDYRTLWSLLPEGWFGFVTVLLVVATGVGTLATFGGQATRGAHLAMAVICVLTAIAILFVTSGVGLTATSGAGRWLGLVVTGALSTLHGTRAGDLR